MPIIWFLAGIFAGSVANALIYRLPIGKSWLTGRSICPKCKHELGVLDLLPLLSYIFLKGKCRYCRKPIGISYFLVELILGLVFVFLQNWVLAGLAFVTLVIAVMDLQSQLVSEWMILAGFLLVLPGHVWGAVLAAATIGLVWALSRGRAMGFGDIEIAGFLGLWLGVPKTMVFLWMAFVIGGLIGLICLIGHITKLKDKIAFGPFLLAGAWIAYFYGATIIKWIGILS